MEQRSIGLLVPASNRVMERDFMRWSVSDGLDLHVNRLNAPLRRPADMRKNLEALTSGVPEAARLLGLARPDVIAFGCTSGSFLRGAGWDTELRQQLAQFSNGAAAVTTASSVVQALNALGARRIAVISPYPAEVNQVLEGFMKAQGFEIVRLAAVDGWQTGNIANIPASTVVDLARRGATTPVDTHFISCTNLRAAEVLQQIEAETGLPVVTANQATYWACVRALDMSDALPALGRLGSRPRENA